MLEDVSAHVGNDSSTWKRKTGKNSPQSELEQCFVIRPHDKHHVQAPGHPRLQFLINGASFLTTHSVNLPDGSLLAE